MKKENLKPFTFYHWIEENTKNGYIMNDICFITDINKTSSPGNYQCSGIEIKRIDSDLRVGNGYVYHFLYGERAKQRKYTIKEISINDVDRAQFFDWVFDSESSLVLNIYLNYLDSRFKE